MQLAVALVRGHLWAYSEGITAKGSWLLVISDKFLVVDA